MILFIDFYIDYYTIIFLVLPCDLVTYHGTTTESILLLSLFSGLKIKPIDPLNTTPITKWLYLEFVYFSFAK